MRRLTVVVLLVAAVGAACGSSTKKSAQTYQVSVDGKAPNYNGGFRTYFPNAVTAHPGDTVDFNSIFTGEPHSVTFGRLVDAGIPKAQAAGPEAQEEPPELQKIPDMLPEGPGDAVQSAAAPCYLKTEDPSPTAPCSMDQMNQPVFDGTYNYYSSGFLPEGAKFSVKLSDNIKPGTYWYFCTLHRAEMSGKVTVVASGKKVSTPTQVATDGRNQLKDLAGKLDAAAAALKTGTVPGLFPTAQPGTVIAGSGDPNVMNASINEFGPRNVSVRAGSAVTWTVIGVHTISFNVPPDASTLLTKAPDGSVHLNAKAAAPAGGPGQPQQTGPPPSGPPGPPMVVDGGRWDGTGFRNTGVFASFPPNLSAYKITFSKPGTYPYVCIIHPGMSGQVTVT